MLTSIGDVLRLAYARGYISTRDGNISLQKTGSDILYITPSGARKTIIHPENIIKRYWSTHENIRLKTYSRNARNASNEKPSGELFMHELLQKNMTVTKAVVHIHCTHIVAAMLAGFELDKLVSKFPELGRYTSVAPNVPSLPPVSQSLAVSTYKSMTDQVHLSDNEVNWLLKPVYDIVGQAGHGVTAIGMNPWEAWEHCERLNHICEIVLNSGIKPHEL